MNYDKFFYLGKPSIYIIESTQSELANIYLQLNQHYPSSIIRMIRGNKSTNVSDLFNEVAAALQFPYYFGENWDALDECITDLDWIKGDSYLLIISDENLLLSESKREDFSILMRILDNANKEWLTPNQYIPRERQPTPFHVLLHCSEDVSKLYEKLSELGIDSEILAL